MATAGESVNMDDESGNNETEVDSSSDDHERTYKCQPCLEEGERLSAVGYCNNCREYLCQRCYDVHRIPSITKKHVLLDKEQMLELESKHPCQQHNDKEVEYHCPTHSFLGCHLCFFQHQKSCKDVICIQEVCTSKASSEEFHEFNQKLENVKSKCINFQTTIGCNKQNVASNFTDAVAEMKAFKTEHLDMIDKHEKEFINKAETIKKEETDKMNKLSQRVNIILKDTDKMSAKIEMLQTNDQTCDLYIELVQSKDKLLDLEEQTQAVEHDKQVKNIMFQPNNTLKTVFNRPWGLGSLILNGDMEKWEHVQDINCKSENDENDCIIKESVLLADQKLLVTDWAVNNTVKLIDMEQNEILSALKLSSDPYGVYKINKTIVAVTLPYVKQVVFLQTDPTLSVEREMEVDGSPYDIGSLKDKLVVSYEEPSKVEIMDMQSTVMRTSDNDSNGQPLFDDPWHLAIHPGNGFIYVSNSSSHNVVCMKPDGTVIATYRDNDLQTPGQITFDKKGMVYVCCSYSKNVHKLTEDCMRVDVILTDSDGLEQPESICYQEEKEYLYIGQYVCNSIKVYKLKDDKCDKF